jgi:hypothetical protein
LRIPLILSAVTVLIAIATACGSSTAVEPAPTPAPTPTPVNVEALIQQSGEAMAGLKTFRFFLSHPSGGTPLDLLPGLDIQEVEGAVINPDGLEARFAGALGALYVESNLISLADKSYLTNPLTGKWELIPQEISPLAFFNPRDGIASMMTQVRDVTLTSESADEYQVAGLIPAEALAPLLGKTLSGVLVSVELTIDRPSHHLREARFEGRVTSGEPDGTIRIITLSGFDEPLSIEPPALP